jgi:DNA invertase Pin-like site-specific DNA recombinase
MIYGYIRVSSYGQLDGASPEEQEQQIRAAAVIVKGGEPEIFFEKAVSGGTPLQNRPAGKLLMAKLQPGDTLIVTKMDRLFRNATDALTMAEQWKREGINLILMDMGIEPVNRDGIGRLFFHMMAALAEFEKHRILERTQEGKRNKREKGGHTGGKRPFGQNIVGAGREAMLVDNDLEQMAIRYAMHLIDGGASYRTAAQRINEAVGLKVSHETLRRIRTRAAEKTQSE